MRAKLSKLVVEKAEVRSERYTIWDSDLKGFGVKIQPSGRRCYFVYYRTVSHQQRKPAIGLHGKITTEEARQIAKRWIGGALAGQDISGQRKDSRSSVVVKDFAVRYLEEYAKHFKKPSSYRSDASNLSHHVLPLIGTKKIDEVSRADIEYVKNSIREGKTATRKAARFRGRSIIKGGPGVANRVVALMSKLMACSVEWGLRADNPAFKIRKYPEKRKDRFLQIDEIGRLQDALNAAEMQKTETRDVITCFRLLLLTGLRCGEVLNLLWSDIDETAKTIKLLDSKTGPRTVPLNDQAWEVLLQHREINDSGYVIKSATGEGRPALGKPWYRIRKQADISETANIHCLRHTFASWAVMGGLSLAQTGALLGHKSTQTTLRYADHLTEVVREYSQKTANQFLVDRTHRNQ